ncbi:lytic transglycosylase domain-containing protein [Lederbergia sp. NSJ-179]|uniref:lytic transglycosylase domain-containing protein n=1 Tax=Lederbergia sp. NSJ-179 TaxID=2931402 RepID=UPI001FD39091|nr:lytic transglycosylase domain-containing protein [Lederbergia sp. NSJ-179]MCJ7840355.1 lytic transglycosylase domain-containing protein [Lederbergia sp. NSJ-179]
MNTLGEVKAFIELQMLQGMSRSKTDSHSTKTGLDFSKILEQTLLNTAASSSLGKTKGLNTLGAFSRMETKNLFNTRAESTIPASSPVIDHHKNTNFDRIIQQASEKFKLPVTLIKSVIKHESNFNPSAVSSAGATGLMQLMPATAKGLGVQNVLDPLDNIMGGSKYLRQMLDKYDGNLSLALAAYNAGPGNVDKYGGIPPFKETQNYVRKITESLNS